MQFADPSSSNGDVLKPADVNGHLLIVRPTDVRRDISTTLGLSDAIVCDVADLDTNTIANGVLWFNNALIGSLSTNLGKLVLARMGQGTAKPGQSPPWILIAESGNPTSVEKATQFLQVNPEFQGITAPAVAAPAAPAGQPASRLA